MFIVKCNLICCCSVARRQRRRDSMVRWLVRHGQTYSGETCSACMYTLNISILSYVTRGEEPVSSYHLSFLEARCTWMRNENHQVRSRSGRLCWPTLPVAQGLRRLRRPPPPHCFCWTGDKFPAEDHRLKCSKTCDASPKRTGSNRPKELMRPLSVSSRTKGRPWWRPPRSPARAARDRACWRRRPVPRDWECPSLRWLRSPIIHNWRAMTSLCGCGCCSWPKWPSPLNRSGLISVSPRTWTGREMDPCRDRPAVCRTTRSF